MRAAKRAVSRGLPASTRRNTPRPVRHALERKALIQRVESTRRKARPARTRLLRRELRDARNRPEYARTAGALVDWARKGTRTARKLALKAVLTDGEPAALFLVQKIAEMKRRDARRFMREYRLAGGSLTAITAWLRFGGATVNMAAARDPDLPYPFPTLEGEVAGHGWKPVDVVVGVPAGKTKNFVVDLSGKLPPGSGRLRLRTAFELHWDRIS